MSTIPPECLKFSMFNEAKQIFDIPKLNELMKYSIIVTTCASAGNLYGIGGVFQFDLTIKA
jgi:hypothetical protein